MRKDARRQRWNARWRDENFAPCWLSPDAPAEVNHALDEGYFKRGSTIVDIGCGRGDLSAFLAAQGLVATGIDFADAAIEMARSLFGQSDRLRFLQADICGQTPLSQQFDCAVDCGCFHSIPKALQLAYARNLIRCLRPGAHFLLLHKLEQFGAGTETTEKVARNQIGSVFTDAFVTIYQRAMYFGREYQKIRGVAVMLRAKEKAG